MRPKIRLRLFREMKWIVEGRLFSPGAPKMNVTIFACPYSANLGDGLLSLCLAREMVTVRPGLNVTICDLAGRESYGEGDKRRRRALTLLGWLPRSARAPVMSLLLGFEVSTKLRPAWANALSNADAAVLGGGNLLADADLNFPLKIAGLGLELSGRGIPWAVFGVGASAPWTKRGERLFESALLSPAVVHVAVRDSRSKAIWDQVFASTGGRTATICSDPAMLTFLHFPRAYQPPKERPILGLNITAPEELRLHSEPNLGPDHSLLNWWLELVVRANDVGYDVRMFTNGSLQDQEYLLLLQQRMRPRQTPNSPVRFEPRVRTPSALAAIIADCDVLAGHRLHAHIAAFSYQLPSVGFAWDLKLHSFFQSVDRGEFVIDAGKSSPSEWAQRMHCSASSGELLPASMTNSPRSTLWKKL